jgi:predicted O-linked N-acetylglucosamine transferase (SPINDLY family)
MPNDDLLAAAVSHHKAGRLDLAASLYDSILASQPGHPDALHNSALIAFSRGDSKEAIARLRRATDAAPGRAVAHNDLGAVLRMVGRLPEAAAALERAVAIDAGYADAWNNLGIVRRALGDYHAARSALERAAALKPQFAPTHNALGGVLKALGDHEGARSAFSRAIALKPDYAEALTNLGLALLDQGRPNEAIAPLAKAVDLVPDRGEVWLNLGLAQRECGRTGDAIAAFRRAVNIAPKLAQAWNALGGTLAKEDEHQTACEAFERAAVLEPGNAEILSNYGLSLSKVGRDAEALAVLERALAVDPHNSQALFNRGVVCQQLGDFAGALAGWRAALAEDPGNREARSNLIFSMQYEDGVSGDQLFEAGREYDRVHGDPERRFKNWPNVREPERRLRIGYVSPDFREHSVAHYVEPLFAAHDPSAVALFAYAEVARPDAVTRRLQSLVSNWRSTAGMDASSVARQIRSDGIDILVDLAGHSANNRLDVFALKPAPMQATWLGFPGTTGLSAIDYRLTDEVADPSGAENVSSEAIVRLPRGFHCWRPPATDIPVALRNATTPPAFGSFNNVQKLSPATIALWSRILRRVPDARLVLKSFWLSRAGAVAHLQRAFAEHGVAPERLALSGFIPEVASHLAAYGEIDVALDPFPYNGTTTTLEALWMGVPVVTLRGERHAARVGASLLSQLGATEWIADDPDRYVELAVAIMADRSTLAQLRHQLRGRLAQSSICDCAGFARALESAYRSMWRRWCAAPAS